MLHRSWLHLPLLLALLHASMARAEEPRPPPTQGDVDAVRQRVDQARRSLSKPDKRLDAQKRNLLLTRLDTVERALVHYEQLISKGKDRQEVTRPLYIAGAALVADDVTGVGGADDVLLPFIGLGILGAWLITAPPAAPAELDRAWTAVMMAMEEVGHAVASLGLAIGVQAMAVPDRGQCRRHLIGCLGTSLARPGSGRSRGHSICADCFEVCQGEGSWPDRGRDGKNCRWWEQP